MAQGSIHHAQQGQVQENGEASTNPTPDSQQKVPLEKLVVNIFFDGTRNNLYNTDAARKDPKLIKKDGSYENYYSNIALLYMACEESVSEKKIYIQGAGTFQGKKDEKTGLGLAWGDSGVEKRVQQALDDLQDITRDNPSKRTQVNVFGFSRGAFYARYFCHKLHNERPEININFAGLFDTVSSEGGRHYNDVKEFHLDIGKAQGIGRVFHLTAQNDYRDHFPLTRINTAANDEVGFECSLPGAHSNIGGGYSETYQEQRELSVYDVAEYETRHGFNDGTNIRSGNTTLKRESISWQWFRNKGYYQGEPVESYETSAGEKDQLVHWKRFDTVWGNRTTTYHYQFITLEIMRDIAKIYTHMGFNSGEAKDTNEGIAEMKQTPVLKDFAKYAYDYVKNHYTVFGLGFAVQMQESGLSGEEARLLYNKYINNSLQPGDVANRGAENNKELVMDRKRDYMHPTRIRISDRDGELDTEKWYNE